jgi:polysaccharide export outer membrane protein
MGFPAAQAAEYRLAYGDILTMTVWGYQQMEQPQQSTLIEYPIRPDGMVAFPLVGEVKAEGMTATELTAVITEAVGKYIKDPKVTLNVEKFRTVRVYVLGEVTKPGLYEIEKQHRLLDAIGLSGGYTPSAAKKHVFIYHKDQTGDPIKANLYNLLNKGDMTQNYELADGDVVYLSDNGRIDFGTQIMPWVTGLYYMKHM